MVVAEYSHFQRTMEENTVLSVYFDLSVPDRTNISIQRMHLNQMEGTHCCETPQNLRFKSLEFGCSAGMSKKGPFKNADAAMSGVI